DADWIVPTLDKETPSPPDAAPVTPPHCQPIAQDITQRCRLSRDHWKISDQIPRYERGIFGAQVAQHGLAQSHALHPKAAVPAGQQLIHRKISAGIAAASLCVRNVFNNIELEGHPLAAQPGDGG